MLNIVIVGGGASGLMAAIVAARNQCKVTIIEQKEKFGKKILATGNGKCNYTNYHQTLACYRGTQAKKAFEVYERFDVNETIRFFRELGIYPKERNGYVYPNSGQATSVLDVLLLEAKSLNVEMVSNTVVQSIKRQKRRFIIQCDSKSYHADRVILATGGCASPKLGSNGSGFELAKSFGHSIVKPLPALVQLKSNAKYLKTISGVRLDAAIDVFVNEKKVVSEKGEILFANYGISGIPVMQVSRFASVALDAKEKVDLTIDFLPQLSFNELQNEINMRISRSKSHTVEEILIGLLNHKLIYVLLKESGIEPTDLAVKIRKDAIKRLISNMKKFRMKITDTNGFDNAQVCAGGIPLTEVDLDTMESKKMKGIYFAGELLDVDGTCGGYNLQWAWSSGYIAGRSQK